MCVQRCAPPLRALLLPSKAATLPPSPASGQPLVVLLLPARPQLAAFLFRYHTALGGGLMGSKQQAVGGAAGAAAAAVFLSGDSGAGVSTLAGMSAAELSQLLTPGSSGRGPFDLAKYPGFCRKMRVGAVVLGWWRSYCVAGRAWSGGVR